MPTTLATLPTSATAEYLGPAPLNPGDDPAGYATLLTRLFDEVGPTGVLEEGCLRDIADTMWEAVRLRRVKAKLMTVSAGRGLLEVLDEIGVPGNHAYALSKAWAARELDAVGEVDALLNGAGLDIGHVVAKTLTKCLAQVQGIDRMVGDVEARRAAQVREIALYREPSFAARLQRAMAAADARADAGADAIARGEVAALPAPGAAEAADLSRRSSARSAGG